MLRYRSGVARLFWSRAALFHISDDKVTIFAFIFLWMFLLKFFDQISGCKKGPKNKLQGRTLAMSDIDSSNKNLGKMEFQSMTSILARSMRQACVWTRRWSWSRWTTVSWRWSATSASWRTAWPSTVPIKGFSSHSHRNRGDFNRCQFYQHFTISVFIQKVSLKLFSTCSLAL